MTLRVTFTVTLPEGPLKANTPLDPLRLMLLSETATLIGPPLVPSILIPPPVLFWIDDLAIVTFTGRLGIEAILMPAPLLLIVVSSILTEMADVNDGSLLMAG